MILYIEVINLLSIIHSVHNVNNGFVAARRGLREGVATADARLDRTVEAGIARRTGQGDAVDLPDGT